jgi:hypothetical protein
VGSVTTNERVVGGKARGSVKYMVYTKRYSPDGDKAQANLRRCEEGQVLREGLGQT